MHRKSSSVLRTASPVSPSRKPRWAPSSRVRKGAPALLHLVVLARPTGGVCGDRGENRPDSTPGAADKVENHCVIYIIVWSVARRYERRPQPPEPPIRSDLIGKVATVAPVRNRVVAVSPHRRRRLSRRGVISGLRAKIRRPFDDVRTRRTRRPPRLAKPPRAAPASRLAPQPNYTIYRTRGPAPKSKVGLSVSIDTMRAHGRALIITGTLAMSPMQYQTAGTPASCAKAKRCSRYLTFTGAGGPGGGVRTEFSSSKLA